MGHFKALAAGHNQDAALDWSLHRPVLWPFPGFSYYQQSFGNFIFPWLIS